MSTNFTGVTFPNQKVTPAYDAVIRRALLDDGILTGCAITYSGSTLTMAAGQLMLCGRQIIHPSSQNWAVTEATTGYARLVLTIDLTRTSTKDTFDQVVDEVQYASAVDGFTALVQSDINAAGSKYQVAACVVSLGPGGITGIVSQLDATEGGGAGGILTVTAPAGVAVTVSNGEKSKAKISGVSGVVTFKGLKTGTWTVTISDGTQTASKSVVITADYATIMAFFAATINITYPAGSACTATDGTTTLTAPDTTGTWVCVVPNTGTWTVTCVDGSKSSTAQVTISTDGQTESISLAYTYVVFAGENSADYAGEWNGTGTDTSETLNMDVRHGSYGSSYSDCGWKGTTAPIRIPSGATVAKITYSTSGGWDNLTNRLFGLRSKPYTGFERGSENYVAYVALASGSNVTATLSLTEAVVGSDLYVGIQGDSGWSNITTNAAVSISKIWIE